MTLTKQDWARLRWPLIILGLLVLALGGLLTQLQKKVRLDEQALRSQQRQLNEARQKFQSSGQEKETIIRFLPEYQRLIAVGFIGEEHRIEWVESLRQTHQQGRLFSINYDIDKQALYKTTLPLDLGPFTVMSSKMTITLDMLHEGDLLTLLDGMNQRNDSPYVLRQCEIRRLNTGAISNTLRPNMQSRCELDWITLHEPIEASGGSQ